MYARVTPRFTAAIGLTLAIVLGAVQQAAVAQDVTLEV